MRDATRQVAIYEIGLEPGHERLHGVPVRVVFGSGNGAGGTGPALSARLSGGDTECFASGCRRLLEIGILVLGFTHERDGPDQTGFDRDLAAERRDGHAMLRQDHDEVTVWGLLHDERNAPRQIGDQGLVLADVHASDYAPLLSLMLHSATHVATANDRRIRHGRLPRVSSQACASHHAWP